MQGRLACKLGQMSKIHMWQLKWYLVIDTSLPYEACTKKCYSPLFRSGQTSALISSFKRDHTEKTLVFELLWVKGSIWRHIRNSVWNVPMTCMIGLFPNLLCIKDSSNAQDNTACTHMVLLGMQPWKGKEAVPSSLNSAHCGHRGGTLKAKYGGAGEEKCTSAVRDSMLKSRCCFDLGTTYRFISIPIQA